MLTDTQYINYSIEFNLFMLRIEKEHLLFIAASLPLKKLALMRQSILLNYKLENLLSKFISISNGLVSEEVLNSKELVTDFTLKAEKATSFLTGTPINTEITQKELNINPSTRYGFNLSIDLLSEVSMLNKKALSITNYLIDFETKLYSAISTCKSFSYTYPHMLEHIIEETRFAKDMLDKLKNRDTIDTLKEVINFEINWTDKMDDHSKFIRGYLDPTEETLFQKSNDFAKNFDILLKDTLRLRNNPESLSEITQKTIEEVEQLKKFKQEGVEGILSCNIKSVILPLLSDHVLREANYYLRLLKTFDNL